MTTIDGIGLPAVAPAARRNRATGGFVLPSQTRATDAPAMTDTSTPVFAAFMDGLLGLQEQAPDAPSAPAVRDREARRHGQALLSVLAEMQLSLIGSRDGPGSLALLSERLSGLAEAIPVAADPRLRAIIGAITLRARVELARHNS